MRLGPRTKDSPMMVLMPAIFVVVWILELREDSVTMFDGVMYGMLDPDGLEALQYERVCGCWLAACREVGGRRSAALAKQRAPRELS